MFASIVRPPPPAYSRRSGRPRSSLRSTSDLPVRLHVLRPRDGCRRLRAEADSIRKRSRDIQQGARIAVRNQQQGARSAARCTAPLLPILQRSHGNTQQFGKTRLGEPGLFSNLPDVGNVDHAPCSPRLSSRSPSRISLPMSRFALVIFNLLTDLPQDVRRNRCSDVVRIDRQHPDQLLGTTHKVDQPAAAPLASSRNGYAKFPQAFRTWDHRTRVRVGNQLPLHRSVFVVAETLLHQASKEPRLYEREHRKTIRLSRRSSRAG